MQHTPLVNEELLDSRADYVESQGLLPEVILRLILSSDVQPTDLRIPTGGSIGQSGWDGELNTETGFNPLIPVGASLWEMSCAGDPGDKASINFKKRTEKTGQAVQAQSSFIFVTPRSALRGWTGPMQTAWIASRKAEAKWKDIRIIDGTKLAQWIFLFPAVDFWLAKHIGIPTHGLETPSGHWENLSGYGQPPLSPEVFLINRNDVRAKLRKLFDGEISELRLQTKFPESGADIVAAYLASLDSGTSAAFAGRCLIIGDEDTWKTMAELKTSHVFVALPALDIEFSNASLRAIARKRGHRVIFTATGFADDRSNSARLIDPRTYELTDALEKCGYSTERARSLALKSGGCLAIFKRLILDLTGTPEWGESTTAADLYIANLIPRWDGNNLNDQKAIEACTGNVYGGWIKKILPLTIQKNPPLSQRNEKWKFISRYEAWRTLGAYIQNKDLDLFFKVAVEILREINPALELTPDERWMANAHGKALKYSTSIREGVAETLVLLGTYPESLSSCPKDDVSATADLAVRAILKDADWKLWASLTDVTPLIGEASPDEFLGALSRDLDSSSPETLKLFSQESNAFTGKNYFTGILWALELLAWNQEYLTRVAMILGKLASSDPGGTWGNRPINSLTTILLPWYPQTCASPAFRETVIANLLDHFPEIGWKLLLRLLPSSHEATSGTYKPAWREWIPEDYDPKVSHDEYAAQVESLAAMALNVAANNREKLPFLIERLDNFPISAYERFLNFLSSPAMLSAADEDKLPVWTSLKEVISKHQKFPDADWAFSQKIIDQLSTAANNLEPKSPYWKHRRLFENEDYNLIDPKLDYDAGIVDLEKQRQASISELFSADGLTGILKFYKEVENSWKVGFSLGAIGPGLVDESLFPSYLVLEDDVSLKFIAGYTWGRFQSKNYSWAESILIPSWNTKEKIKFLSFLPFKRSTWTLAERMLGDELSTYWASAPVNPYQIDIPDLNDATAQLIKAGRFREALRCLGRIEHEKLSLDPSQGIAVLEGLLKTQNIENTMDSHNCIEVIKSLQENPETDLAKLQMVEWGYLPLLDGHRGGAKPKSLERALATDPGFFCSLISSIFRSRLENERKEPTESEKRIAQNAYALLHDWSIIPGRQADGSIDENIFKDWFEKVKARAEQSGHLEVSLIHIGQVLSHAPKDLDGTWISHTAAKVLDAVGMDAARNGYRTAIFNRRGAYFSTKGRDERDRAQKFRKQAADIEAMYPRLAEALRDLAKSYERQAEREETMDPFDD